MTNRLMPPSGQSRCQKMLKSRFFIGVKQPTLFLSHALTDHHSPDSNSLVCLKSCTVSGGGDGGGGGDPRFPPSPSGSPRGTTMAMVIMSPLSELTDTDGFEMRSISQRAPPPRCTPPPPRHCWSPSLSSTTESSVGLPRTDGKAKFNSVSAAEAPVTHF